jgi:hypothetical protein
LENSADELQQRTDVDAVFASESGSKEEDGYCTTEAADTVL